MTAAVPARSGGNWRRSAAAALLFAAICVAAASPVARAGDPPVVRTPEFAKRVEASIAKGVAWLRAQQRPGGTFAARGTDLADVALVCHALRVCRVPADDPVVARAYRYLWDRYESQATYDRRTGGKGYGTQDMGLLLLALADRAAPAPEGQDAGGASLRPSKDDLAWMTAVVANLEKNQLANGAWPAFASVHEKGETDYWYVHFAVLGLRAARSAGVKVKTTTWTKAQRFLVDQQAPPAPPAGGGREPGTAAQPAARGWDLHERPGSADFYPLDHGTAEALASLAICRSELLRGLKAAPEDRESERVAAAFRDGLEFLARRPSTIRSLERPDERPRTYVYEHAFSIERAGDVLGLTHFGDIDWYGRGADALVAHQETSGAWVPARAKGADPSDQEAIRLECVEATSYALLFLARGSPRAQWTLTSGGDDEGIRFDGAGSLPVRDFEDLVDLVLSRWARATDAEAKARLFGKATAAGPRIVPSLVRRLSAPEAGDRAAAFALLRRATGLDHGYDPAADDEARTAAVKRWEAWWTENSTRLHYDQERGLLVP